MIEREGDLWRVTAPMTMAGASALAVAGCREIETASADVFDFSVVTEVDSAALAVMLTWQRTAAKADLTVRYVNVPAGIRALADLYGVDDLFTLA